MIDNLIATRSAGNPDGTNVSGNATFGQGQSPEGNLTPVRQSIPGPNGIRGLPGDHAEPQVMRDLGLSTQSPNPESGPVVLAVDQNPCDTCNPMLNGSLPPGSRVIVPENPAKPGFSPKSAARDAADGTIPSVQPRTVISIPPETTQVPGVAPVSIPTTQSSTDDETDDQTAD